MTMHGGPTVKSKRHSWILDSAPWILDSESGFFVSEIWGPDFNR